MGFHFINAFFVAHPMISLSNSEIKSRVAYLATQPLTSTSHAYNPSNESVLIREAAQKFSKNYCKTAKTHPAIRLIDVILAAHRNYNKQVKRHVERMLAENEIRTFNQLIQKKESISRSKFYDWWGHRDLQKYTILSEILEVVPLLRTKYPNAGNDFFLMNCWAKDVNIMKLEQDPIGRIPHIGVATVQHLRMTFGANTVKPDQRVKEVLQNEFGLKKSNDLNVIRQVEYIAQITGLSALEVDQIFVNYGSGYYVGGTSRKRPVATENDTLRLRIGEIAKKLKKLGVDNSIIAKATRLKIREVNELN